MRARQRERKRWCSWTCSSTTAADDGCTRRITASSEFEAAAKNEKTRARSVTERYATRSSATTREERERERQTRRPTDRPIDHCLLGLLTSFVLLCILQRGRGQDEVIVQAFSVPSAGFQGSPSGGRVPEILCCCVESEDYSRLRDGNTAVCFRAFCGVVVYAGHLHVVRRCLPCFP